MTSMRDVARAAGVALSTVSAVLGKTEKYVSPEIRNRVLEAATALDYRLPLNNTRPESTIAVLLPVISSIFFSQLLSGIETTVAESGHTLLFGSSGYSFEKEKQFVEAIRSQALCGLILDTVCPAEYEKEYLCFLRQCFVQRNIPVVFLERSVNHNAFYSVYVDHEENARSATKHLLELGHRKIAHIAGISLSRNTADRLIGYKRALEEYNVAFDPQIVSKGDFTPHSGYIALKQLMSYAPSFTAVFSANDQMAIGAIKAVLSEGKSVPGDIAVMGIDNLSVSSMVSPSLSTINVPTYQMGTIAAKTIIQVREGTEVLNPLHKLKCNLIVRRSTDPYAGSEWDLFGW